MATVQCGAVLIGIINSDNKNVFPLYFSHSLSPLFYHDFAPRYSAAFLLAFILLDLQIIFVL